MQVSGEEKINDASLPVLAHCLKDVDTGRPTKAELWPREQAESGLGLGVLGLLDTNSKLRPTGASYQEATRDLLQLGTWVNQSKTHKTLAEKLAKYVGGFETYEDKEKAGATSWFLPSTSTLVNGEATPKGGIDLSSSLLNLQRCNNIVFGRCARDKKTLMRTGALTEE